MVKIISMKEAKALKLPRYFTGRPCTYGHVSERQTCNYSCMACNRLAQTRATVEKPGEPRIGRRAWVVEYERAQRAFHARWMAEFKRRSLQDAKQKLEMEVQRMLE